LNVKEYIESGVLEAYAIGLLNPAEMQEVEETAATNPAIKKQLKEEVETMSTFSKGYSMQPPAHLREQVLNVALGQNAEQEEAPVKAASTNWAKIGMVAATVLFLVSTGVNYTQYQSLEEMGEALSISQIKMAQLETKNEVMVARYENLENNYSLLTDPSTTQFVMKGVKGRDPSLRADIFWHSESEMVYLNIQNLPAAPADKVYQLWALKDGKPIDMGVFDSLEKLQMQELGSVPGADAFAVTLEPKGGSENPTLEEMYVYGEPMQV
jgi:anti-sigma-K factor RskA